MYKTQSELYELISDEITRTRFDEEILKRYKENEGLLSEDAIAYLIVDELGANVIESATISGLQDRQSVSLVVRVHEIGKPREFSRKNGTVGQVVNIVVADRTAKCRLALWDKDVETVKDGRIKVGSTLRIANGYVKVSDFGVDINIGRWGQLFIDE